jgi:mRNA deadenylase 3'-5' endonuclease subunit Ccr4
MRRVNALGYFVISVPGTLCFPGSMPALETRLMDGSAPFPSTLDPGVTVAISVLTYNILLPNSQDGWWTYKMYPPRCSTCVESHENDITTWSYRQKLLKNRIAISNPDVVCLQEVSPASFESDLVEALSELGYDSHVMHKKGRFRPATFWKSSKLKLASEPSHKDRSLLTIFSSSGASGETISSNPALHWYVLNCHLQAGPAAPRRLRQINEGIKAVLTTARKLKGMWRR